MPATVWRETHACAHESYAYYDVQTHVAGLKGGEAGTRLGGGGGGGGGSPVQ